MSRLIDKISVKTLAVVLVVFTLIGIIMPLSAFAEGEDDVYVYGSQPITVAEVQGACLPLYAEYLGVDENTLRGSLWFSLDSEMNVVYVYEQKDGAEDLPYIDIVYYTEEGIMYSVLLDRTVKKTGIGEIVDDVSTGVSGAFGISASAFDFILGNDLCVIFLCVTLAGVGLALIGRGFKTARK